MLTIKKKFGLLNVVENWYECRYQWKDLLSLTAYMHVKNDCPQPPLTVRKDNYTIENDLRLTEEEIFGAFTKQYRNQIRQAETEGVNCYFHKDIPGFVEFFNDFAATKGINLTSIQRLEEMGDELLLSYAEWNGRVLAAHSYHYDKAAGVVRTYQSASVRLTGELDKNLIGKANKLLHYKDMLYFKQLGIHTYDFGGYAGKDDKRDLKGINEFKLNFGEEGVSCVNYFSIPYYLLKTMAAKFGILGNNN